MDINVQHFLNRTADEQVKHFDQLTTPEAVADTTGMLAALQPLADAVVDALNQGELMRATLTVQGTEPTTISFETGIINLPFANAKKVGGFFEADEIVPVNVYLVTENAKFLNASGLRIDELATSDDFAAKTAAYTQLAATTAVEQLAHITEEAAKPQPVVKEVPANKAKTTKKTTRKTTTRKTTAKKTTTRKTTAKKATTTRKRTTAKKATK